MKAFKNEGLFLWFIDLFGKEVKESRKKDTEILKALRELAFHHVKPDGKAGLCLLENGYSKQEILYLNLKIPSLSKVCDSLSKDSIVMERIAAAGCQDLLNAVELEDKCLFKLCTDTLKKYDRFAIKLEGAPGLKELLVDRISIKNVDLFCYLLGLRKDERLPDAWFHINLVLESKWDELAGRLTEKEYRNLFEKCIFEYGMKEMDIWLDHYERLTGKRYERIFWTEKDYQAERIFKELVAQDKYDVAALFRQYVADETAMAEEDCKGKWSVMLQYIHSIGKNLYCHGIFRLWEEIDAAYGIQSLDRFMENKELLALAVNDGSFWGSSSNWYGGSDRFWKNLGFLNKEESVKLFMWAEEYFYKMKPQDYNDFQYEFLKKVAPDLLPAEEGRALMETIISAALVKSYEMDELRKIYYEPEEWDTYQMREQERKEKEKAEARRNEIEKWKKEVLEELDAAGTEREKCAVFSKKLSDTRYGDKDKRKVCLELLEQRMQKGKIYAEEKELAELADELLSMVEYSLLDWKGFREMIKNMEVSENESAGNGAA